MQRVCVGGEGMITENVRDRSTGTHTPGRRKAILVPQLAVTHNTKGEATATVVGKGNQAEVRILQTARAVGNQWLVSDGLKPGEQLIVDNLEKVRPGAPVKPVPAKLAPAFLAASQH